MLYKYFKMWTFILIGLNIISMVYGYASGYFPQACGTMLPLHGADPQTSKPPYEVSYQQGHVRDPITVCLSSPTGKDFMGFMLKALDTSKEEGPPLGKFTLLDSGLDQLLTCSGSGGSVVSHKNNRRKTRICVNWTAPQDAGASTTFRATFSETYKTFWTKVDAILPPPTPIPSTSTSTQPSATTSTQPSTATSAPPSTHPGLFLLICLQKAGTVKMNVVLFLGVLKMELSNIFLTALSDGPFSRHLNKVSQTFFVVLCGVVETSALALFCLANPINVSLVALVSVAIVFNIIELVIVCLPIGPSHELKEISDHVVKVSSFIHQTFTTAAIFVGILEVDKHKGTRTDSRILKVMVAFTVLLLLFEMWVFLSSTQRKAMLRRKTGCPANRERGRPRGKQKKLGAAKGIVIAVSVIFIVAFLCFGVTVAVMILGCHQEQGCA
uniref:Reelin domain-containing protein n=1 Tax=Gasterosteus aculeatus aculeatus TaxID=481459 RepID=G3PD53_GASAC